MKFIVSTKNLYRVLIDIPFGDGVNLSIKGSVKHGNVCFVCDDLKFFISAEVQENFSEITQDTVVWLNIMRMLACSVEMPIVLDIKNKSVSIIF